MFNAHCEDKAITVKGTGITHDMGKYGEYEMFVDSHDTYYIQESDDLHYLTKLGQFDTIEEAEKKAHELLEALLIEMYKLDIIDKRKGLGLSQTDFGKKFGIPMRTIQNWEGGFRLPPRYVFEMMLKILELEEE